MSQEKVDHYKEQKRNRKKIMKKEKRQRYLGYSIATLIAVAIIGWASASVYKTYEANKPVSYTEVDMSAITDYYASVEVD